MRKKSKEHIDQKLRSEITISTQDVLTKSCSQRSGA